MTDNNLADFLARHTKPYDPAIDTYRRAPFALPVKSGRSGIIYNAHTYHTKVPPEGIVPYIEHYTDEGDLVLDLFCGSGMTGVAALIAGRSVILNDLSPAAAHIAQNYTQLIDTEKLRIIFQNISREISEELGWLYTTKCDNCNEDAAIEYTIWSDVFECGRCGNDLILWDIGIDRVAGKVLEQFTCPRCQASWKKSQLHWVKSVPVLTNYHCGFCKPARGQHPTTDYEKFTLTNIDEKPVPHWFPTNSFDETWEMWRGVHGQQKINDISKFYTRRNLWALSYLWKKIHDQEDPRIVSALEFIFTGFSLKHATKMTSMILKGGGQPVLTGNQPGTLYIPSLSVEKSIVALWKRKGKDILDAFDEINRVAKSFDSFVRVGSATNLSDIPDNSIDYVFTDPPFGSNIFYADCNFIWEAWLDKGITDQSNEAVVHVKHKNKNILVNYAELMQESFREIHRVLKPSRWASVVFHNSDDRIWQTILDAAERVGLELVETNAFDKGQLSFKGIRGAKGLERVTNKDIVLNLRKPGPSDTTTVNERTDLAEAEQRVLETVADFLKNNPPAAERSLQYIWNQVLYGMIRDGSVQVSMAGLEEMLAYHYQVFKMIDGHYYLRGEAVVGGNVFNLQTDTDALTWLASVLADQPLTTGELIPLWQKETAHLGNVDAGRLDRLLEQNFWLDKKTGRWRNPSVEEREQMNAQVDLAAQAHLRVVRRYISGDLDRTPDDRELSAWIRFCYNREFYAEAAALFEHVNEAGLEPDDYKTIKKMAAVAKMKKK